MLDDYAFGYLALVLRINADCSRAKSRFHPGYVLFLALAAWVPEHLAPRLQCFVQLLRQTANCCRGGFR